MKKKQIINEMECKRQHHSHLTPNCLDTIGRLSRALRFWKNVINTFWDSDGISRQVQWISLSACLTNEYQVLQPGWNFRWNDLDLEQAVTGCLNKIATSIFLYISESLSSGFVWLNLRYISSLDYLRVFFVCPILHKVLRY